MYAIPETIRPVSAANPSRTDSEMPARTPLLIVHYSTGPVLTCSDYSGRFEGKGCAVPIALTLPKTRAVGQPQSGMPIRLVSVAHKDSSINSAGLHHGGRVGFMDWNPHENSSCCADDLLCCTPGVGCRLPIGATVLHIIFCVERNDNRRQDSGSGKKRRTAHGRSH